MPAARGALLASVVEDLPRLALDDLAQLLGVLGELGVAQDAQQRALAARDPVGDRADLGEHGVDPGERRAGSFGDRRREPRLIGRRHTAIDAQHQHLRLLGDQHRARLEVEQHLDAAPGNRLHLAVEALAPGLDRQGDRLLAVLPFILNPGGTAAIIVATVVMRIGRNRMRPASSMAVVGSAPSAMRWLANSTRRIEFLVTNPNNSTMPIRLYTFSVIAGTSGSVVVSHLRNPGNWSSGAYALITAMPLTMPRIHRPPNAPSNARGKASQK